jgi:hypothetical protein
MWQQHPIQSSRTACGENSTATGECNVPTNFSSSEKALVQSLSFPSSRCLEGVKSVIVSLAHGQSVPAEICRDWNSSHLRLVRTHRLAPWLYYTISQRPQICVNKGIFDGLRKDLYMETMIDASREAQLKTILNALGESKINVILLKGAYLANWVYDEPSLRMMNDVDLLVHPDNFQRTKKLLLHLGYVNNQFPLFQDLPDPSCTFSLADAHTLNIDLHWQLRSMDYYYIPDELIWKGVVESRLFRSSAYVMSPELNFVHLTLHTLNHHYLLRNWLDMVLLLLRPGFNWDRLLLLACWAGVQRPLYWALLELVQEWGIMPPVCVRDQLAAYDPHWLEDRVIRGQYSGFWRLVSRITLLPSTSEKVRYLFSVMHPTRGYMEYGWGTRSRLDYVYSGVRKLLAK